MVPPEGLDVRRIDWPESIAGEKGETAFATRAAFTVTVPLPEHPDPDGVPWDESVTVYV